MHATAYDIGRYFVSSDSGNEPYLVDVIEERCDCIHFRIRVDAKQEAVTCKHITFAKRQWRIDFTPEDREHIVAQQKRKYHFAPPPMS